MAEGTVESLYVQVGSAFDSAGIKQLVDSLEDLRDKNKVVIDGFKDMGIGLTALATTGIIAMKSLVDAYSGQQLAETKLANALRATGQYSDSNKQSMIDYANAMQKMTKYSDDEIISAETLMTQIGVQPGLMKQATLTAMNLASALGIDLTRASMLVAKAGEGNVAMLQRYGIHIDAADAKTQGLTFVLDKLNEKFGGSAQAEAETYAGKVEQLKNQFADFEKKLGEALLPTFEKFVSGLANIVKWFNSLSPEVIKSGADFLKYGTAVSLVVGLTFTFMGYLPQLAIKLVEVRGAVNTLAGKIGIMSIAITVAYTGAKLMIDLYDDWATKSNKAQEATAHLQTTLEGKIVTTEEHLKVLMQEAAQMPHNTQAYQDQIKVINNVKDTIKKLESQRTASSKIALKEQAVWFSSEQYGAALSKEVTFDQENDAHTLAGGWTQAYNEIVASATNWKQVFCDLNAGVVNDISQGFQDMYKNGVNSASDLWKDMSNIMAGIKTTVVKIISDMVADAIVQYVIFGNATKANALIEVGAKMYAAAASLIESNIATFGWFALATIPAELGALYEVFNGLESNIQGLAQGGLITSPQLAMIGEAGPELALPLNSPNTISALSQAMSKAGGSTSIGGNSININVNSDSIPDARKARQMGQILGDEIFNRLKRTRKV